MKLYVGTYAKYNAGSIAGAWLDLNNYANADDFVAACRRLHRDEADPEIMFQDVEIDEDWEQGLYNESSVPGEWWTLKAEEEAKAKAAAKKPSLKTAKEKARQAELLEKFMTITHWGEDMRDHFRKSYYFVELPDGAIFEIEIPQIQTRFCCGEDDRGQGGDGPGTLKFAQNRCDEFEKEQGFKGKNMRDFDRQWKLESLDGTYFGEAYYRQNGDLGVVSIQQAQYRNGKPGRSITAGDLAAIREGVAKVRADFEKRLNAYWKRFGASKLRTWTYWTEA